MKKLFVLPLLLSALCASTVSQAEALPASVDVKQAAALQGKGVFLLDVREPYEFAEVHAKGATLIPLGQLSSRLNEIAQYKNKPVEVICRSGRRSAQGAEILRQAGFSQVANVEGGTNAWVGAGLPVVRN
ncbi:MAG TPA: rhodanese-like domain-containing protein [Sideroxyarcus sp.]|nr:rhodanese-like domain-containing protein [Sideroxyarcus sp.]